jgi:1-acyl-sn-glycerol-3-phosphate acyltransferase
VRRFEPWTRLAETALIPPIAVWLRWRFEGLEQIPPNGPILVACNHISYFDPLAHGYFVEKAGRRPRFLAKVELYRNPLVGAVLRGARQIPVRRGSGERAPFEAAVTALGQDEVVVVYPEATVTTTPDLSPMRGKSGIARMTLAARVPVVPLAVWGTAPIWQRKGSRSLRYGRPVWVKAGAPLDFSRYEDRPQDAALFREVTDEIMTELSLLVDDLRSRYPKRWA